VATNWDKLFAALDKDEQQDLAEVMNELKQEIDSKDSNPEVMAELEVPVVPAPEPQVKRKGRPKGSPNKTQTTVDPEPQQAPSVPNLPEGEAELTVDAETLFQASIEQALKRKAIDLDEFLEIASASFARVVINKLADSFKKIVEEIYKQKKKETDELPF
jgi:hypothetical protein